MNLKKAADPIVHNYSEVLMPDVKRILVVDDEDSLRQAVVEELTAAGYEVENVSNGMEAITLIPLNYFDLVLLDISMPLVDGIEALKHIHKNSPNTKVIMLTGEADLKHALAAHHGGAVDYITKPFSIDEIVPCVKRAIG